MDPVKYEISVMFSQCLDPNFKFKDFCQLKVTLVHSLQFITEMGICLHLEENPPPALGPGSPHRSPMPLARPPWPCGSPLSTPSMPELLHVVQFRISVCFSVLPRMLVTRSPRHPCLFPTPSSAETLPPSRAFPERTSAVDDRTLIMK